MFTDRDSKFISEENDPDNKTDDTAVHNNNIIEIKEWTRPDWNNNCQHINKT